MQTLYKYSALLSIVLFCITTSQAQSLPITSYGVWDRGGGIPDYSAPNADFVKGIETSASWEDIQPNGPGTNCDFSAFQTILDVAVANDKLIRFSVNVGPDCPMWVFDNGVPLVNVISNAPKNDAYANRNPYYPDPEYKAYYFEMIRQFALFLRNQPQEKFDNIAFVQVKTGATGDEEPYKGTVTDGTNGTVDNTQYDLTEAQWEAFRLEAFAKFKEYFNDVSNRKIVLTFNNVDPIKYPDAYDYVMNQLDPVLGFGIKGGAFNRGHHLSEEQSYKEQWNPFLINPKVGPGNPNGVKLFSASEMDQSWDKGYFALNYEIGFYWSALGGINTGLSCTNISVSAMTYALANPGIIDIFKMYNRYAQQVYPATATTAFSVFHEGLNSEDTVKFPVSTYGTASRTNLARYQNICNDPKYANRGARIDDPIAVVKGQVFQREDQEFYNDAGWDICEGNIERFMTQINPDATSIGLFRVRGPITATSSKYDRFARSFENSTGRNTMYFQLHNEFPASNKILKFTIIWLDKTAGSTWAFKYRNATGLQTLPFTGTGTNQWRTEIITISDAIMNQGGTLQSDFMLVNTDVIDDIFNGIEMNILGISKQNQTINFNALPLKMVGDADFSPLATASSGLAVSYTSSNTAVATIVNGNIQIVGGGSSIITASQAGDNSYNAAISVAQNLAVSAINQAVITTSGIWTAPAGINKIKVEAWGGGGGGGGTALAGFAGGGAGGSYVINDSVTVLPATSYAVTVGAGGALTGNGGANGNNGGNTTFGSTTPIIANGGVAGSGTTAAGQLGSGGTNTNGGSGGTVTLGFPGASGATGSGGAGGAGALGGTGAASRTTVANGFSVTTLGGGGGGAYGPVTGSNKGGAGGAGQIKITYTVGVPNAPTIGTATVSGVSGQASIPFTAPAFNGNSTITSYTATSSPGGITGTLSQAGSGTILVTGLTNGTAYTFTITATNGVGQSTASAASNAVTPYTVPDTPIIGDAAVTGVSGQATVSFTAPASNGGSPITSYTATSSPGGITGTLSQAGSGTIIVNGLTNETAYTFTVRATNAGGLSAVSGTSNAVTPITRVPQTIIFGELSAVNYGDAVLPAASASSGLPVTYTSDNPLVATTSGSTITVVGAGSVTISAVQAGDGTYAAATPVIQTLVVNKKTLSITSPSIASKVYNSLPNSGVVTPGTLSGFLGTETVTATATGLYADANIGTAKLATITYLLADGTNGGKAANYSLASSTAEGLITQAPLTVVGIIANNKPEDGNTMATLSALGSLSGVFASDTATVTLNSSSVSANFDTAAVGTAKPVTISGYSITGSASANYSFAQPTGITANITVPTTFYLVSTGTDFNATSNWWSVSDGTGLNPSNLTTANTTYTIYSNATTTAPLTLGSGSKIVVGNASVAPVTLTVDSGFPIVGTIDIAPALSGGSNIVLWKDISTPTFGSLDNTSEVHLQAVANYSTSAAFGKLFIDPASGFTIMSGTPTIKTSLTVPFGSGLSFSNNNGPYIVINSGASVSIDGYLKTGKVGGAFAYNVTTPVNTLGSLQFAASTPNFTLGSASTIEYSRTTVSSTQTISALPNGVNYANLTITDSGSIGNKSFPSSVTVNGTFTLNQSASTLTGCTFLNLANGATIVRTAGALNAAPAFGTSVNVTYNCTTAQTPSFEMPADGSVLNNLTINNAAGFTLGSNTTVNGTLALTAGVLTTGLNIVTVAANGSTSRTAGWVNGNLRKFIPAGAASATFEIGDLAANYTPVTTAFTGAITGSTGSIVAKTAASDTTTSGSGIVSTKSVNRTWTLTNDNAVPGLTSYDATFTYASTDNDAGTTPANYAVKLYATAWSTIATSGTTTDTAATASGITSFGEFAIGETPGVPPAATISASGAITFCTGGSVTLTANTGSGLTYLWSPGGATTQSITATASGNYTVIVTNTGGETTSAPTTVTVNDLTTNGSVTDSICAGGSYIWPANGVAYTTAQTGLTYTVGCNTATLNLTVTPAPASAGTSGSLLICAGTSVDASSLYAALGGTKATGGTWSPTLAGAGTYTYTQAATSPCTTANTATVTVTEQAAPNAGTNGTLSLSSSPSDEALFAALTGADEGGSWSRPSTGYLGTYTYTVNATSPCTGSDTSTVTVTASTLLPTEGTTLNFCTGAKVSALIAKYGSTVKVYAARTLGLPLADVALTGTTLAPKAYYLSEPAIGGGESLRILVNVIVNALPATPSLLVLTNDNAVSPATSTTAVTAVGVYVGTNTPFKLTATAGTPTAVTTSATSYVWTLPSGVVRTNVTGEDTDDSITSTSTDAFIYVKFTGTGVATPLVINVQSVNASGCTSAKKPSASLTRLLPTAPSALAMNNGVNTTAITSFAKYMGSPTVLRLSATAAVTATSYLWELPTGVNRMTALEGGSITTDLASTDPFIFVNFAGVTEGNTDTNATVLTTLTKVLRIGVKSVNGVGSSVTVNATALNPTTTSTAKLLTLTAIAPAAPTALVLNNGTLTTAITVISKFIGQGGTYRLATAVPATTVATSFAWELPSCVTRVTDLSGSTADNTSTSTDPFIYVKFNGTNPAAGSIYFGVKAVNGIGSSVTNNSLASPGTSSTAKLLKLATVVPAAPASLAMNNGLNTTAITVISKMIGQGATVRLLAATSALASSYAWELPACVTRVTDLGGSTADNTSTSTDPFIFVKFNGTNPAAGSIYFGVTAVNGVGSIVINNSALVPTTPSTAKLLKLVTAVPAGPTTLVLNDLASATPATAVAVVSKYIGTTTKLKLTAAVSVLANTYEWELPDGVNRVDELGDVILSPTSQEPFIFVNFLNVPHENTTISLVLGVKAVNSVGSSITANTGANSGRTDKLLIVTAGLPVKVAAISGSLTVCDRSQGFTYVITAPLGAKSYIITAPVGSVVSAATGIEGATPNVLTTSELTFKVVYNGTPITTTTTDKYLTITSVNDFGNSTLGFKSAALIKLNDCSTLTSAARIAAKSVTEEFNVIAYPNPSTSEFNLDFTTSSTSKVEMRVYDMSGKLLEVRQMNSEQVNDEKVGNNYPSGVYNVIVTQDANIKTLRVIKQ